MALKINLKDGESVYFGTTKVTAVHDGGYTILVIDGGALPVLKESETITLADADTPEKRIYYHLQQRYLTGDGEHLKIAEATAEALSDESHAIYEGALSEIERGKMIAALRVMRRLAGL
ncbi:flagellar biosynthesis repressor FlbT [Pelagibacterium mangrovi]|uniref:flagellar biosynthesis repressor FlbT n=1 Tax=Pelagibacterium mangrovi TaxID=3119828 RepID=UPI002FC7130E